MKSMFLNKLKMTPINDDEFELLDDFVWQCNENTIIIPKGFVTDLASVPKLVRFLPYLDPLGKNKEPAVLHDYLYSKQIVTRKQADKLFRKALKIEKIPSFWAGVHYVGVRVGGRFGWNKRKKKLQNAIKN